VNDKALEHRSFRYTQDGMAGYQKLLVLLDLSSDSEQVAIAGRELAALSNGAIVALHVVEFVPVEPMGESLMPTVQIEDELIKRSEEKLRGLAARLGLADAKLRVEAGNTKAEILRVAHEENADLIVVGSRERHGLAILVNFTEDTVLHAAHCDVLAVRLR
jgi:universal stress protein A